MAGAVAIGFHRGGVTGDTLPWADAQVISDGDGLSPNKCGVFEAAQGCPAGTALVEVDQGKATRVIPVPAYGLGTVKPRQQGQQEQPGEPEQAREDANGGRACAATNCKPGRNR